MAPTPLPRWILLLALSSFLVSCRHASPSPDKTTNASTQTSGSATCAWCPSEQHRIDALVTPALIFPAPEQRKLFDVQSPTTEGAARTYGFVLRTQPGMVPPRHFCLVSVMFSHASPTEDAASSPTSSSTAGPNGSFMDASAQTMDHAYRVRVSLAMLLPVGVQVPTFDPMKTLTELLRRYESATAKN